MLVHFQKLLQSIKLVQCWNFRSPGLYTNLWLTFYRFLLPIDLELILISLLSHFGRIHCFTFEWTVRNNINRCIGIPFKINALIQQNELFVVAFIFFFMNKNVESTQLHHLQLHYTSHTYSTQMNCDSNEVPECVRYACIHVAHSIVLANNTATVSFQKLAAISNQAN